MTERKEGMGGLAKGLRIVEAFATGRTKLSVSEAAAFSDTSPAAARRCLLTLLELGYVIYDGKYFHPTPRLSRLAFTYTGMSLPQLAQPYLDRVRDETGRSATLAILEGQHSVFIARAETDRLVSAAARLGSRITAHTSSTGRVQLAGLDEGALDAYLKESHAGMKPRDAAQFGRLIREGIQQARQDGFSYSDAELEHGVRTLAVPLRDSRGTTVAAIGVSAFANEATIEQLVQTDLPILLRESHNMGNLF